MDFVALFASATREFTSLPEDSSSRKYMANMEKMDNIRYQVTLQVCLAWCLPCIDELVCLTEFRAKGRAYCLCVSAADARLFYSL